MNRNYISRRIRRHGVSYILKHGNTLQPFSGYLKNGNLLWVTALELPTGSLIAPLSRPTREYIVSGMTDQKLWEEYSLLKINCRGTLARFSDTGTKDTFGRATTETATPVYLDLPLFLHQSVNPTDQSTPDRSATRTGYRFSMPSGYTVRPKDRLIIGDTEMIVTTILIQPDNLQTFEAQDT